MAEAELHRKSPDGALTIARELEPEEPGLVARIDALRNDLVESKRLEEAARKEEEERSGATTSKYRLPSLILTLVLTVILFGRAILDEAHRARPIEMTRVVPSDFGMLGIMALGILIFRKRALKNRAGRQLSALFLLALASSTIADTIHASRGETSAEAGPLSVILIGSVYLGAAIGMGGRLWWAAIACYVAGIIGAIWPETATSMVAVGAVSCLGALIYDALGPPPKPDF
jgi:F0F1-type ATP synthase assembly protein I